jgi:hypothetical protein
MQARPDCQHHRVSIPKSVSGRRSPTQAAFCLKITRVGSSGWDWSSTWILRFDSYTCRGTDVLTKWTEEPQIATGLGPELSPTARPDYKNRPIPLIQSAGVTPRCCQLIDISAK